MNQYWQTLLLPLLTKSGARTIVEIGTERGEHTELLAAYCKEHGGTVHAVDTDHRTDRADFAARFGQTVTWHTGLSLNVLPELHGYDTVIIDGDHNWFTVRSELGIIEMEARHSGTFPIVILHDTGWPYGRRDSYCDTRTIPLAYQQPRERKGMIPGRASLADHGGLNRAMENAIYEGTPSNGVLTAVEDFLRDARIPIRHLQLPGMFGISILVPESTLMQKPDLKEFINRMTPTPELLRYMEMVETVRLLQLIETEDTLDTSAMETLLRQYDALKKAHDIVLEKLRTLRSAHDALQAGLRHLQTLEITLRDQRTQLEEQRERIAMLERQSRERLQHLERILRTKSWKCTAPLRYAGRLVKSLLHTRQRAARRIGAERQLPVARETAATTLPGPDIREVLERLRETGLAFATHEHPHVSIIIPVWNQIAYTVECLESLRRYSDEISYEVIVVDDGSTDATQEVLGSIKGITVLRNAQNEGFTRSCNAGASAAHGTFLVFLNNDTVVSEYWLQALLRTFEEFPDTGIAGPKFIGSDRMLLEAGGAVWNDGTAWNIGRGKNPELPEYTFVREVDYVSGACLMIPKALFRKLGGFDDAFSPAYYEDTDLAFRVREAGYKVRYQPHAEILHYEGATAGKDPSQGAKKFQELHRKTFVDRWHETLLTHPAPSGRDHDGTLTRKKPAVLVLDVVIPRPDKDSGSLRMFEMVKLLRQCAGSVTFLPSRPEESSRYTKALESLGVESRHRESSVIKFLAHHAQEFDVIIISRADVAFEHMEDARYYAPHAKIIFDTVDLHYIREMREAEVLRSATKRVEAQERRKQELYTASLADAIFVVSDEEERELRREIPGARIIRIPNIHRCTDTPPPWEHRAGLLFVGGFLHTPNTDAMLWFTKEVFPLIEREIPGIHLWIVGSNPPESVRNLAGEHVTVTGFVPDISPFLSRCRVSVAPLRFGAGIKGKVTQSICAGLPIVATTIGAEGTGLSDGEEIFVANEPADFAHKVVLLYNDKALWQAFSERGAQKMRDLCSPERIMEELKKILPA